MFEPTHAVPRVPEETSALIINDTSENVRQGEGTRIKPQAAAALLSVESLHTPNNKGQLSISMGSLLCPSCQNPHSAMRNPQRLRLRFFSEATNAQLCVELDMDKKIVMLLKLFTKTLKHQHRWI